MARCPICGDGFDTASAVREHAWTAHTACHYCGDRFDDDRGRYVHWLVVHDDELSRLERKQAETAVDTVTLRDRLAHHGIRGVVSDPVLRRRAVLGGSALVLAGGIGGIALMDSQITDGSHADGPAQSVATAPIPASPSQYRYAVMGPADADLTITYFGSWKCPYCAQFSTGFLTTLVREYVRPGKIAIKFRDLAFFNGEPFLGPDAPAAGHAGLAVWHTDPQTYWTYHEYVMAHQPPERKQWATPERLATFARRAGVSDPGAIRNAVKNQRYTDALRATSDAATRAGVNGTPALFIDGTMVSPFDRDKTHRLIETALN